MVCDDVKRIVYFYLDGQLGDQKKSAISSHLEDCKDCDDRVTIHKRLRLFISKRLEPYAAPDRLRLRIKKGFESLQRPSAGP